MAQKRDRSKATPAPKRDDGTQLERVRGICLSIPNTLEKISHGAPTFFTPERVFAVFADNHPELAAELRRMQNWLELDKIEYGQKGDLPK